MKKLMYAGVVGSVAALASALSIEAFASPSERNSVAAVVALQAAAPDQSRLASWQLASRDDYDDRRAQNRRDGSREYRGHRERHEYSDEDREEYRSRKGDDHHEQHRYRDDDGESYEYREKERRRDGSELSS